MATGIVKWFNNTKGFGFINSEQGDEDIFVHYSVIMGDGFKKLTAGQVVDFESESGSKGMVATKVYPQNS